MEQNHDLSPQQVHLWKREFLSKAEGVFESKVKSQELEAEEEKDRLLKSIVKLKVEDDFLKNAFR